MPPTALIAISRHGAGLAGRVHVGLEQDSVLFLDRRFADQAGREERPADIEVFDLPLGPVLRQVWHDFEAVVLFLPVGAAVRLVAPLLQDKRKDPALVCVDDAGSFAVSVVSGHIGGADDLALRVAGILKAQAVVTTGSHATGTLAVDLLGREFGWEVDAEPTAITRASAAVVNREPVAVFQSAGERNWWHQEHTLPDNITIHPSLDSLASSGCSAALIISDEPDPFLASGTTLADALPGTHVVLYRPQSLVAGMGCRRGVPADELERHLVETFGAFNLSLKSLSCLATATLKEDEPGLQALAGKYRVPLKCFDAAELNGVFEERVPGPSDAESRSEPVLAASQTTGDRFDKGALHPSDNARRLVGVWGVAEPAALLASESGRLVVEKQKAARSTVAVARIEFQDIPH